MNKTSRRSTGSSPRVNDRPGVSRGWMSAVATGLLIASAILFGAFNDAARAQEGGSDCGGKVAQCAQDGQKFGETFVKIIKSCRAVRRCRQECRQDKRDCVQGERADKRDCRAECRDRFGPGELRRKCRQDCRQDFRADKRECRETKRDCREVCRSSFNNDNCRAARREIVKTGAQTIGSCAALVACIAASESSSE